MINFVDIMLILIISCFILKTTNCSYSEIEGVSEPLEKQLLPRLKIVRSKYYWFEHQNRIYLLSFFNNSRLHKNPFISMTLITGATKETWPLLEICQLLTAAFDNFQKNSVFVSLLPNKHKRHFYSTYVTIAGSVVQIEVSLGTSTFVLEYQFSLEELASCNSFLKQVKIGTRYWTRFYKAKNQFYSLFVETCYVTYPKCGRNPNSVLLFRIGEVIETTFTVFQTNKVGQIKFLKETAYLYETILATKNRENEKNQFVLKTVHPFYVCRISFDLEEKVEPELRIFFDNVVSVERTGVPAIEKLLQVGQKVYLLIDETFEKLTVQVPVYFFGQRTELSKLVVVLRFVSKEYNSPSEVHIFFAVFDFHKRENRFLFYVVERHFVYLEYAVDGEKLVFSVSKLVEILNEKSVLVPEEIERTAETPNRQRSSAFLSGAIIYNPKSLVVLTSSQHVNEESRKSKTKNSKNGLKWLHKKQKRISIYLLVCLLLVVVCFFVYWLYFQSGNSIVNKRRRRKVNRK